MRGLPLLRILVAVAGAFLVSERRAAAGYNRDYVGVRLPITYVRSGASGYKGDYRIRFRLLDENCVAQELRLTGNTTGRQLDVDDTVDLTAGAPPSSPTTARRFTSIPSTARHSNPPRRFPLRPANRSPESCPSVPATSRR